METKAIFKIASIATLFIALPTLINAEQDFVFTTISPKIIQSHSTYNVLVTVDKAKSAATFLISINSTGDEHTSEQVTVEPGMSATVPIVIPELTSEDKRYDLTVKAEVDGETAYENSTKIYVDPNVVSLLIQTDKPVYKPGETVKFRVILMDRQLKPLSGSKVEILLRDPQANIIKKWSEVEISRGIFSDQLELSKEPNLGDWKLHVTSDLGEATDQTFAVEQYVLPKFKTEVILPPFATYNNSKIQAEIKSTYTYGKGVKGEAKVTLSEFSPYPNYRRYYQGKLQEPKKVVKTVPLDGSAFVEFDIAKELEIPKEQTYTKEFQVDAVVTEGVTAKQQNGTSRIKLHEYPYKIQLVNNPKNYKPGFPLTLTIKVSTQDDKPIQDENPEALTISHGFAYNAQDGTLKTSIPSNGLVTKTFMTPSNEYLNTHNFEVEYKNMKTTLYLPHKITSQSKAYLQITPTKDEVETGENIHLDFQASKPFTSVTYLLYSRGEIQLSGIATNSEPEGKLIKDVQVALPENIGTKVTVVAYAIFAPNYEFVADSVEIKLKTPALHNFLNISTSESQAEPGSSVGISISSKENSLVALRGVDQSVLILKQDRDINMAAVEKELQSFDQTANQYKIWGGSNSFQIMEEIGLVVITNGHYERNHAASYPMPVPLVDGPPGAAFAAVPEAAFDMAPMGRPGPPNMIKRKFHKGGAGSGATSPPRVRTKFPETWIWEQVDLNETGMVTLDKVVPDTLTSWMISGFSLNSEHGIGVTLEPTVMEVFRPFFITLNKPYSVVKGEILALQVLVHNYQSSEVNAKIVFGNGEKKFQFGDGEKTAESQTKTVSVKPKDVASVTFLIVPQEFGVLKLNVVGTTENSGDAISQPLIVKPPGQKQVGNEAVLIDLNTESSMQTELKAAFPEKRVEGADYMKISVIGDIMGSAMKNLDKLLQMPSGCGEQNMLHFVPDLVILDYLESSVTTSEVDPKIRKRAIHYLESGYQRELKYRHDDGSFSAFGKSDSQGSTWLTAFVIRSFIAARKYITIDDDVINTGLQFLADKQQADGEFREYGKVLHSELKGGVDSSYKGYALSAYALLAFLEASDNFNTSRAESFEPVETKALEYITSIPDNFTDSYALNLITYALEIADHEKKDDFFNLMENLAHSKGSHKWWETVKSEKDVAAEQEAKIYHPWRRTTKPSGVEMTAYAMLTFLSRGERSATFPIAKWLLSQRNENGGFISTQDTVVGLTALGKFAEITKSNSTNLNIKATYGEKVINWEVNDGNSEVLHENELSGEILQTAVEATGEGTALVQLTWHFYVEGEDKLPAFSIDIKVKHLCIKNTTFSYLNPFSGRFTWSCEFFAV